MATTSCSGRCGASAASAASEVDGDAPVRAPDEIEPEVLEEMDLDGDGAGVADPEYDVRAVEDAGH